MKKPARKRTGKKQKRQAIPSHVATRWEPVPIDRAVACETLASVRATIALMAAEERLRQAIAEFAACEHAKIRRRSKEVGNDKVYR